MTIQHDSNSPEPAPEQRSSEASHSQAVNEQLLLAGLHKQVLAEQLQHQLAFVNAITQSLGEGVYALNTAGRFTFVNPAAEQLLGWQEAELLGSEAQAILPFYSANSPHRLETNTLQAMMRAAISYRDDDTILTRRDMTTFPAAYSAAPIITDGAVIGAVVVFRDISAQKQAEAALRSAEAKYRTLVEQMPAIVYTAEINEHSSTSYVSPQIEQIMGFSPEAWLADPNLWLKQAHPDDRARLQETIGRVQASDTSIPTEYRTYTRDGRLVWLRDTERIVRDETGSPLFLQGLSLDITDRKLAEQALIDERALLAQRVDERTADLRAVNAELAQALQMKDEFLASMSHELRTPLAAILGLSEALQEGIYGGLNTRQHEKLLHIEESGQHLLALINDILDLSKLGAGKLELDFEQVLIEEVCQASLRLIQPDAQKKKITIESSIDPAAISVRADSRRLKQILINLLSNAVKFTPVDGMVGLFISGDLVAERLNFVIWDTGIGIAPEDLVRLFQPFVQLDSRLSRQYDGTGLGLALVAHMVDMHSGSVTVSSTLGIGSRFTVSLPWPQLETPSPASSTKVAIATILLAEDNAANSSMIDDYLSSIGYQVVIAHDGAEAISLARTIQPTLILMDIQMPGIDGLEATRRIRADQNLARVPIIALTALTMPGDYEMCIAAGASAYLSKPVNLHELASMIAIYLRPKIASG